jgi:catechol 2,3-dioxygenase-like lactoylglutathione lyase family enzyme
MTVREDHVVEFAHIALLVSDIERSKRWYRDLLGWQELFSHVTPTVLGDLNGFKGTGGDIAMGEIRGVRVEFVQMHTDEPLERWRRNDHYGMFLLSVRINDVEAVRERCRNLGVEIVREGLIGQTCTMFVVDPDGQEVGLVGPLG